MIVQSASLDITMSLGDIEDHGSIASSKDQNLFSEFDIELCDTMDKTNCATYASKQTNMTSIPVTIYYDGLDSMMTEPRIQNARKVSVDSPSQLFADVPAPQKIRPTPHQNNPDSLSVPQMQWTPPQPVSANNQQVQSSKPKYDAQLYDTSAMHENVVPAIPVEELSTDGFTDADRKRGSGKTFCVKVMGRKLVLILVGVVIVLATFAIAFSIAYTTGSDKEDKNKKDIPTYCHSACYDPLRPGLICKCECYTKEDDKYYTCSSQTEVYYPESYDKTVTTSQNDRGVDNDDDNPNDISINNGGTSLIYSAIDDDDYEYDDFTSSSDINYDDSIDNKDCSSMCYRHNIHRDWSPNECNPSCYDEISQYDQRHKLWMQWHIDDAHTDAPTEDATITNP